MSSSGGIGGNVVTVPIDGGGSIEMDGSGQVKVNGSVVALDHPDGAAVLLGAVGEEQLAEIMGMLRLKQVETTEGPVLVPADTMEIQDPAILRAALGPMPVDATDALDQELGAVFVANGLPDPYNANTTPELLKRIKKKQAFKEAVGATGDYFANPTPKNERRVCQILVDGAAQFVPPGVGRASVNPFAEGTINIMEILFATLKESIRETYEDKKYFLLKLQTYNNIGEGISGYLQDLAEVSRALGADAAGEKYPEMVLTKEKVDIKTFDLQTTDPNGKAISTVAESEKLDRAGLNDTIKEVESVREMVRNNRQMASTAFQNFDQKSNQLFNMTASVMKSMNEMRMGAIRNWL